MACLILLDASALIGYLDATDAHHEAAQALLVRSVDETLIVNPLTLAEVLVVPARDNRLPEVLNFLRDLDVQEKPFPADTAVRLARLRADTGLKTPDCCVLLTAEDARTRIASFDDRLAEAARRRGLAVVPGLGE